MPKADAVQLSGIRSREVVPEYSDQPDGPMAMLPVRLPRGFLNGAVVELAQDEDGIMTAVPRIPAPQPERM